MSLPSEDLDDVRAENRRLKERLAELERRRVVEDHFRGTLDGMIEGFQLIGFDWRYLYLNEAAARHGRRPREELLGRTMSEAYPGIERTPLFEKLRDCMEQRRHHRVANEFEFPDGSKGWFELTIEPSPAGVVVLSIDVTDRHLVESRLRQSQKMEAVGRLAGGIAHDFNNLLTGIQGFAEMAREAAGADSPIGRDLAEVLSAADRAAALTAQLLAFSRRKPIEPVVLDLNRLVRGLERMFVRLLGEDVEVRTRLAAEPWNTRVDPGSLEQVLVNLGVNARDAMPAGGLLLLETRNEHLDEAYVLRRGVEVPPGEYVVLSVSDTGTGMTKEVRERIFEPFFTTKPPGRGTGLGLATCYGIVAQAGGYISVYSEDGRGTTFKIYLPRVLDDVTPPAPIPPAPRPPEGDETVLVVEDEDQVRALAERALARRGYRVLLASRAADAVALSAAATTRIDLLLTDVVLPDANGREVAERILADHPAIRILYVSGYSEELILHRGVLEAGVALLQKPFSPDALVREVRRVLDARPV